MQGSDSPRLRIECEAYRKEAQGSSKLSKGRWWHREDKREGSRSRGTDFGKPTNRNSMSPSSQQQGSGNICSEWLRMKKAEFLPRLEF